MARALTRTVFTLSVCQGLMTSTNALVVACAALVGVALADDPLLATLPAALKHIATMACAAPASFFMARWGRKRGFLLAAVLGILGGVIAYVGIVDRHFWLFCLGTALFGLHNGFGNFYRFAAVESVVADARNRAISYVLAGGIVAAFLGPNIAALTRESVAGAEFAGSFLVVAVTYVLIGLAVSTLRDGGTVSADNTQGGRRFAELWQAAAMRLAVLSATVGFAMMVLLMTATPLAMQAAGFAFAEIAWVIQAHVVAMFLPSFFTGRLTDRFGVHRVIGAGAFIGLGGVVTALTGEGFWQYWMALVLLGVSWNFLYVGGTSLLTTCYAAE
ncbi:MAG: MFS transporter, partial [Pseudomonadota bacterium]